VTPVNTSYHVQVPTTTWEFCWSSWTLQCSREVYHVEERTKTENITRVINKAACCPGYKKVDDECIPSCDPPCSTHGSCSAPGSCRCSAGWSGARCQERGCPGGRWGEGCTEECNCLNGGKCHSVNGTCYCPAGYNGTLCQDNCKKGTFGENCSGTCSCTVGHYCHHINGECVKCPNDTFGEKCEESCECDKNGTALCSHIDGRCFCEPNWFGSMCQLNCPFGFVGGACIQHLSNHSCSCPSELFLCDPHLGCVCPSGDQCGIEQSHQDNISAGLLEQARSPSGVVVVVLIVLVIGVIICCLVVVYYRKRLGVLKKDLANRTGQHNTGHDNDDDIFTPEPLTPISQLHIPEFPVVENNQLSFSRPDLANNPMYIVNYKKPEKNVNIDKEKQSREVIEDSDILYQEPQDIKSNLNNIFAKTNTAYNDTDEDDTYDHIGPKKP